MNVNDTGTFWAAELEGDARRDGESGLVQIVVAVAIVGILASASYGSYQNYDRRANRAVVQQFILQVSDRQHAHLRATRAYSDNLGASGLDIAIPSEVAQHYSISIAVADGPPPAYVITASPRGSQSEDGVLSFSSKGEKLPKGKWH